MVLTLAAGEVQTLRVRAQRQGRMVMRDIAGGAPLVEDMLGPAVKDVTLPAADHSRRWRWPGCRR